MGVTAVSGPSSTGTAAGAAGGVARFDRRLLDLVRARLVGVHVAFTLWDGVTVGLEPDTIATVHIRDRATLLRLCWDPQFAFGEAYATGSLTVDGDLVGLLVEIYRVYLGQESKPIRGRSGLSLRNTTSRSKSNVHRHYDIGNAFYRLWLDDAMLYTCAYYADPSQTLEQAQRAKMEYVCRKLRLRRGERVVEAGAGWGALAIYMAKHYGVSVTAYNVSGEQVREARARAVAAGVEQSVTFIEDDYRVIQGEFDVFVSVGMLEHVGPRGLGDFGAVIDRALRRPDGRGLLHFIGRNYPASLSRWIRARIFPGAYPPALGEVFSEILAPYDLAAIDVENLRHHYARTLADWLRRYREAEPEVERMYGPEFVRTWRLYLAGSEAAFRAGSLQLFQVEFARAERATPWWTREDLYAPGLS